MVEFISYELFEGFSEIDAWTTTRGPGCKKSDFDPYLHLNLSYEVGDSEEAVTKNREEVRKSSLPGCWIELKQVHGNDVFWIEAKQIEQKTNSLVLGNADALLTREKGLRLIIKHADCQGALFYDPIQHVIGALHAGWRGLTLGLYSKVIQEMIQAGSSPGNIYVAISPSLQACCSEFKHWKKELGQASKRFMTANLGSSMGPCFDLLKMAACEMEELGILSDHIQISPLCTCCESDRFFSYRRYRQSLEAPKKGNSSLNCGRLLSSIMFKS